MSIESSTQYFHCTICGEPHSNLACPWGNPVNILNRTKTIEDFIGQNYKTDIKKLMELNSKRQEENTIISRRLSEIEAAMELCREAMKFKDSMVKRPYKCPICEGCGNDKGTIESKPNFDFHKKYAGCHACEGNGIIWG